MASRSSRIARVKTIAECAHEIGRKPVLLGRSMEKYSVTAEQMKLVSFPETTSVFGNRRTVDRTMRRMMKAGKEKFLPIVTGHQGEPGSILTRIALGDTPYQITKGDKIIFSANVIPNPMNFGQRYMVEAAPQDGRCPPLRRPARQRSCLPRGPLRVHRPLSTPSTSSLPTGT